MRLMFATAFAALAVACSPAAPAAPTAEEIAEHEAWIRDRLNEFRERGKRGECTDCGQKITAVRQVGSCVYADPCGHRIGQGDARAVRKALGLP